MQWLIHYTWCLPQQLIGLLVRCFVKVRATYIYKDCIIYYTESIKGACCIGNRIFMGKGYIGKVETTKHEYGHYKQSLRLGWLWIFVIGIPSLVWAGCFQKYRIKNKISYYSFYTEKWANKLGGVEYD